MSLTGHIQELKKKHQSLAVQVEQEQRRPGSQDLEIAQMKKQKLHLKQEIERLSRT